MQELPLYKKLLSYLTPLRVDMAKGYDNTLLELYFYRGQWQLANDDALYSDGNRYRPLRLAFKYLRNRLPEVKKVLVLGTGLGSAVRIMSMMGFHPAFTLVDIDKQVLQWTLELADPADAANIMPVCSDAKYFIKTNKESYDLVVIDIFNGRVVPEFVSEPDFLGDCKACVAPGGNIVFNFIVNNNWTRVKEIVDGIFPHCSVLSFDINRVIVTGELNTP